MDFLNDCDIQHIAYNKTAKRQLTWLRRNEAIHWILWEKTPDFSAGLQNATEFLLSAGVC